MANGRTSWSPADFNHLNFQAPPELAKHLGETGQSPSSVSNYATQTDAALFADPKCPKFD